MKLFLKIGKLLAILLVTVTVILIAASFLLKDKVGFIILKSINKNLSTKLDVGSYDLSFFRKFPKASLELKNVLVHSSHDFDRSEFIRINTDTLLAARSVSLEFRITDILTGVYTIERIAAKTGKANFFTDTTGHVNYNISIKSDGKSHGETLINLERINVTDINAYYNNLGAHLIVGGIIKSGKLKTRISGSTIDFIAGTDLRISRFELYNFKMDKTVPAWLDISLQSSKSGMLFHKAVMHIEDFNLTLDGFVSSENVLDLNVTGDKLNIAKIRNYLPDKYLVLIKDYGPSGFLTADSKIKGLLSRTSNPHVDINWKYNNGRISYKNSNLTLKDLSFSGHLTNGAHNKYETSIVTISDFKAKLGSSQYTGSATLKNFSSPLTDLELKGRVYPGELKEFFNIREISTAEGSIDLDLKIANGIWPAKSLTFGGIIDLKPQANMTFNSFTIGVQNNKMLFSNVNGNMVILNSIKATKLHFRYKGQNIVITGEFRNLPEWLSGRRVMMTAKADVIFDRLIPEAFFTENDRSKPRGTHKAVKFPGDLNFDINFRIDSLRYKTFFSSDVQGKLNYQPKTLTFTSLKMKSMSGLISGNGFIFQNNDKSLVTKGSFTVNDIDVNNAFTTFHNFGQSFLKAGNIRGTLSGSLSLLFPVDSMLNFHIKTLTAEGKYHLVDGALINFDPVKQLSSFIELSELENIKFDKLENDFSIHNNLLYIPQMEVKSSAADLSVTGKHSFDNDYEYHVRILLSEVLSRKRNKNKSNVTEFGIVEDDGLGRTSLLLKILGKGETAKVSYDMKAAGTVVRDNFKKDKQSLKTILNEEYGWYKNDSTVKVKQQEKKARVKVKWDDGEAAVPPK